MKVYVMVDMEGISGVVLPEQVSGTGEYERARKYITDDANACVEGCFNGGATDVLVVDAHWRGFSIHWDLFDSRATLSQGRSHHLDGRMHSIAEYDALILLGYHAMAGTPGAVLEHTMTSKGWQNLWINGRLAGEIAIDAGIAGDAGVPTIMASGCDKACKEAQDWMPGIHPAVVKTGLGTTGAELLGRTKAHDLIRRTAETACKNYKSIKPLVHNKPLTMRLELVERGTPPQTIGGRSYLKIIDGRTYEVQGKTTIEALARL